MEEVIIVPCPDYRRETIKEAMAQMESLWGGFDPWFKPGTHVVLKPNLLAGEPPERAVTTHPEIVRAIGQRAIHGGARVSIGDSPGFGTLASVAERAGIAAVCRELDVPLGRFNEVTPVEVRDAKLINRFELAREVVEADCLVNIAKMKTHGLTVLTGAVKNLFGCVVGLRKPEFHFRLQKVEHFADMLLDLTLALPPTLHVVDAVQAMEGWGPRGGTPRKIGLLVAGKNPVSVDIVLALLMNVKPDRIPYLASAMERGWAGADPSDLKIMGDELERFIARDFHVPRELGPIRMRIPGRIVEAFRKTITPYPAVMPECQGCGVCAEACPAKVIAMKEKRAVITDKDCIRCYCCQEMCPFGAIQLRTGWLGRIYRRQGRQS